MKYAVMANLKLETPAQIDSLDEAVNLNIGSKSTWGEKIIQNSFDEAGHPAYNLEVRFYTKSNMDELYQLIKAEMEKTPALKGTVSKHYCYHDEGIIQPCVIREEFTK